VSAVFEIDGDRRRAVVTSSPTTAWFMGTVWLILTSTMLIISVVGALMARSGIRADQVLGVAPFIALWFAVMAAFIAIGVFLVARPRIAAVFDAKTREVTLSLRSLVRQRTETYAFAQIAAIGLEQGRDEDGGGLETYHAIMHLRDASRPTTRSCICAMAARSR
jgi:FtsH-binding integral membrane protein